MERVEVLEHCQCRWRPAEVIIGVSLTRVSRIPWVSLWFCTGYVFFFRVRTKLGPQEFFAYQQSKWVRATESPNKNMKKGTCTICPKRRSRVFLHDLKFKKMFAFRVFPFSTVFHLDPMGDVWYLLFHSRLPFEKKHGTIGCFSQRKVDPKAAIFVWQLDHTQDWLQPEWLKVACFYVMVRILRCL